MNIEQSRLLQKSRDVTAMDKTSNDGRLEENLADVFIDIIVMKTDEVDQS